MSVISCYAMFNSDVLVNIINLSYVLFTFYQTVLCQAFDTCTYAIPIFVMRL